MKTVIVLVGTRPEVIKMATVYLTLKKALTHDRVLLVSTGQHREMLNQSLKIFGLTPDLDLNLMTHGQSLSGVSSLLFKKLDELFDNEKPDLVLSQGDTTTVQVSSLVCFYKKIKFAHVEAGLRTGDLNEPFPEELNRIIADQVADYCFAPTVTAYKVLKKQSRAKSYMTGNTVVDALLMISRQQFDFSKSSLSKISTKKRWVLVTAHRRESFGKPLQNICDAIKKLARQYSDVEWIFPVHLNPNVKEVVGKNLSGIINVHLLEPLDYLTLVHCMKRCALILTDSGGIQEEAPSFGVPVLVLRDKTERPEGIKAKVSFLVGTNPKKIITTACRFLNQKSEIKKSGKNPYGDGKASLRIAKIIKQSLK